MDNTRKDRFIELSKNDFRTLTEETEFQALGQEFPETMAEFAAKADEADAKAEVAAEKAEDEKAQEKTVPSHGR